MVFAHMDELGNNESLQRGAGGEWRECVWMCEGAGWTREPASCLSYALSIYR